MTFDSRRYTSMA